MREYLDSIVAREHQPKIIGVTGNASGEFSQEGEKAGMNMVVTKPLYVRDLKNILKKFNMLEGE
jgi:CheY-like chemotaxis protein